MVRKVQLIRDDCNRLKLFYRLDNLYRICMILSLNDHYIIMTTGLALHSAEAAAWMFFFTPANACQITHTIMGTQYSTCLRECMDEKEKYSE